ncbi:MAG TPA: flagellar hook capping FlgD N-terminal domain-containing protein [bacterium]|jgi:flagellar basal-body rod modification protein FlgD|nr:flagellar hook capping FlgD N-terminal domain-containing protein [bacterium]
MYVNTIQGSRSAATASAQLAGKDEFLQLLVTQLRLQDPLEPIKEREFIAQLAQFSTLEAVNNMSQELGILADLQQALLCQNADQAAVQMIGHQITLATETGDIKGIVTSVRWHQGRPQIIVHGEAYDLGYVKELEQVLVETEIEDELA